MGQEEDDLIREWREKGRVPLVSPASAVPAAAKDVPDFVVHKMEGTSMQVTMDDDPTKYKVLNFGTFDFLGMSAEFTADNKIEQPAVAAEKNTKGSSNSGFCEEKKETEEDANNNNCNSDDAEEAQVEEGRSK